MNNIENTADRAVEIICDMIGCDALTASETLGELIDQGLIPDLYEEAGHEGAADHPRRLRDGVKQLADDFGANAEYAPNIHAHTAYIEAEQRLTNLLEGDTK